jgi:hypothetical protein
MSDQRSQGGKKQGNAGPEGTREQHQPTHLGQEKNEGQQRPPTGEPGGPKPSTGKTRPQD